MDQMICLESQHQNVSQRHFIFGQSPLISPLGNTFELMDQIQEPFYKVFQVQFKEESTKQNELEFRCEENSDNFMSSFLNEEQPKQNESQQVMPLRYEKAKNSKGIKKEKEKQKKPKNKDNLKNFLTVVKRCIIRLFQEELRQIGDEEILKFLSNTNQTSRLQFQLLFKNNKARVLLKEMFLGRKLQREIQISRAAAKSRYLFLSHLDLIKKAFILNRLPNL